jgi:hypothetical protein
MSLYKIPQFILACIGLPLFALGGVMFKWALECERRSKRNG